MKDTILLIGKGPDSSTTFKMISYAPYAIKKYADTFLSEEKKETLSIKVIDFDWDMSPTMMADHILNLNPVIVGFSTYIWNYSDFIEVSKIIKKAQNILVLFGGPQVSPLAENMIDSNQQIDIIPFHSHFGETIFLSIVENYKEETYSRIPGIYYRQKDGGVLKSSRPVIPIDYNSTPSPYPSNDISYDTKNGFSAVIETSRGCPFDCGYCFWGHDKKKIDYFPIDRALKDIEILYNDPHVKYVYFADANFLSHSDRAKTILKKILSIKKKTPTIFEINFLSVTEKAAKLLNKLPDFEFLIAIQTTNLKALNAIGKKRAPFHLYERKLEKLKKQIPDLKYRIDVMLGLPEDDINGYLNTLDNVLSIEPQYICINYPVFLLPGTRFFNNRDAWGIRYSKEPPYAIIETPQFPKTDIEKALKLSIWVQILTYYYPAIAAFFYSSAKSDGLRIKRINNWVLEIEKHIDFMAPFGFLVDIAITSVNDWNIVKKKILQETTNPTTSLLIYESILKAESSLANKNEIKLGVKVFRHLKNKQVDTANLTEFDTLPLAEILVDHKTEDAKKVLSLFSVTT